MTFSKLPRGEEVRVEAVLSVLGAQNLKPYLISGGESVVDFLLSTTDNQIDDHVKSVDSEIMIVKDDRFMDSLQNQVFPLCGNSYSYINRVTLTGIINDSPVLKGKAVVSDITYAEIVDDEGDVINIGL